MFNETTNGIIAYDKRLKPILNGDGISCEISKSRINDYIEQITLKYANNTAEKAEYLPFYQAERKGSLDFYIIPCVNYNGNDFGDGKEPKGLDIDGEPWIFSSDRTGTPGCGIVLSGGVCHALFGQTNGENIRCSASIFKNGQSVFQRIYFTHVEYPKCYLRKFDYGEPIIKFLTINAGETQTFECFEYKKDAANGDVYSYDKLFDYLTQTAPKLPPRFCADEVKKQCFSMAMNMVEKTPFGTLSNMGLLPDGEHKIGDENCKFIYRKHGKYEIGWCGQNITVAEMFLRKFLDSGDTYCVKTAIDIVQTWLKLRHKSGLVSVNYDVPHNDVERIDMCNEGWLVYKLCLIIELIKANKQKVINATSGEKNIDEFLSQAENCVDGICEVFFKNYPQKLPQAVYPDGSLAIEKGCAGAILAAGIAYAYKVFKQEKYLRFAIKYFDAYYDEYLKNSLCAGGALDTYCVDKESAGPILRTALLLYEYTNDKNYLQKAENIAHYLMTWTFYFNVPFDKNTDCGKLDIKTVGGTAVSVAHHHIDCWGIFYVPDMIKLYNLTCNAAYLTQAEMLWNFTLQYSSDGNLVLHGMKRPYGTQNEAVIQCNWHGVDESKGLLNDWLVAWVKTFQLDVLYSKEFINSPISK